VFVGELVALFVLNPLALTVLDAIGVFDMLVEPVVVFVLRGVDVEKGLELLVLDFSAELVASLEGRALLV